MALAASLWVIIVSQKFMSMQLIFLFFACISPSSKELFTLVSLSIYLQVLKGLRDTKMLASQKCALSRLFSNF